MSDFWAIVLISLILFAIFLFVGWLVIVLRDGRRLRGMGHKRF